MPSQRSVIFTDNTLHLFIVKSISENLVSDKTIQFPKNLETPVFLLLRLGKLLCKVIILIVEVRHAYSFPSVSYYS